MKIKILRGSMLDLASEERDSRHGSATDSCNLEKVP